MNKLKIALLGATFLISAGAAQAADLGGHRGSLKDEPVYAPAFSWTGFYLGGHLGGSFGDEIDYDVYPESFDIDNAFLGGVHVGYNVQTSGNIVLGIEGDISASGADFTNFLASIRGRLGIAANRTLFYATGGVAFLDWDDDAYTDSTSTGWVAGLGVEHKLTQNLSIGAEGLYYSFSETDLDGDDFDRNLWAVRGRLTYHFGGDRAPLK